MSNDTFTKGEISAALNGAEKIIEGYLWGLFIDRDDGTELAEKATISIRTILAAQLNEIEGMKS